MRSIVVVALALFACDSTPPAKEAPAKQADAKKADTKKADDTKLAGGDDGKSADDGKAPEPAPKAFAKDDKAAVLAAYKAASGSDLGDDACVEWPPSFPRVTLIGGFAHDRGCDLDGVFVDGE
ncbi:MAG TPA: hypothetical protein VG755_34240, partial [Nannocystaceae bacterium]|nr:hypothetical protein [Nannocystaceae bacterium]